MEKIIYWQGDVGLEPIDKVPSDAKKLETQTIAYGEATGHHHSFNKGGVKVLQGADGTLFVDVQEQEAILEHQEHAPISIPKKIYRVVNQRVFDVQKGIHRVID